MRSDSPSPNLMSKVYLIYVMVTLLVSCPSPLNPTLSKRYSQGHRTFFSPLSPNPPRSLRHSFPSLNIRRPFHPCQSPTHTAAGLPAELVLDLVTMVLNLAPEAAAKSAGGRVAVGEGSVPAIAMAAGLEGIRYAALNAFTQLLAVPGAAAPLRRYSRRLSRLAVQVVERDFLSRPTLKLLYHSYASPNPYLKHKIMNNYERITSW